MKFVDIGGLNYGIPVTRQIAITLIVGNDEDDIGVGHRKPDE